MSVFSWFNFSKYFLLAALLLGFSYSVFIEPEPVRQIASTPDVFKVNWSSKTGLPDSNEQEFTLEVELEPLIETSETVEYKWILPTGTQVVAGNLEDEITGLKKNQKARLQISVIGISKASGPRTIMIELTSREKDQTYRTFSRFNSDQLF